MDTPRRKDRETVKFASSAAAWDGALISTYAFDRKRDQQAYDDLKTTHQQQREAFKIDDQQIDGTNMRIVDTVSNLGTFLIIVGVIIGTIALLNMFS